MTNTPSQRIIEIAEDLDEKPSPHIDRVWISAIIEYLDEQIELDRLD